MLKGMQRGCNMTKTVFKLLIQTETLEPARQDKDQMEITCSREKEVILEESGVDVGELYLKFIDYLSVMKAGSS